VPDRHLRSADQPRGSGDLVTSGAAKVDRRLAWTLVWLYPPAFRRDVGLGLVDAMADRMRERRTAGGSPMRARLPAIADAIKNAAVEWVDAIRGFQRQPVHHPQGRSMADTIMQDIRYALRLWRRRPAFAGVAILTLAIGIGANTAMFSLVNAVLLRPLPYPDADRLVSVWSRTQQFPRGLLSYAEYQEIRKQNGSLDSVGLFLGQSVNLTGVAEPQRLVGVFATGTFFDVLGLRAERGRLFTEDETAPGTVKPVVVITHQTWRQRFNEDPSAIGSTMVLNGQPLTVVGVLEPPFNADEVPGDGYFISGDLFMPAALWPAPHGIAAAGPVMLAVGRIKRSVGIAAAAADLDVIGRRMLAADPKTQQGRGFVVESAHDTVVGSSRSALLLLLASVGVVLLIACVNVSNLLLARAMDRQKEIALRAALGASRGVVARQLAVEAGLLAAASAGVGFALGVWLLRALDVLRPPSIPVPTHVPLDWTVLLFTGAVAIAVATLCGLAPALKTARPDISRVLAAGARRASSGGRRTREVLVVAEMAMSVALVAVAVLLIQSLLAVQNVPLGFDPTNVFTLQFRLPQAKYPRPEDIALFFKNAIERVRAIPGVESAALVRAVPFSGNGGNVGYVPEGASPPDPASLPQARFHLVTPDYFKTLRIPLLKGRDFTDRDNLNTPLVSVVNETFARRAFPDGDAIGKRFTTPQTTGPITIIGVVGDTRHYTATEPAVPQLYASHFQVPMIFSSLVARTSVPPLSITNDVRKAIWSVDKDQPVWSIYSLQTAVDRTQGQSKFLAALLAIFAGVALLLAGVGIYGVTAYGVAQRTHEIGIRLALGASGDRVLGEIIRSGARLIAVAVLIGIGGAIAMGQFAAAVLFAVTPTEPAALGGAAAVLAAIALLATYVPARRAARVDPVVALSEE
jgi:putative ABC transport system permease protein